MLKWVVAGHFDKLIPPVLTIFYCMFSPQNKWSVMVYNCIIKQQLSTDVLTFLNQHSQLLVCAVYFSNSVSTGFAYLKIQSQSDLLILAGNV